MADKYLIKVVDGVVEGKASCSGDIGAVSAEYTEITQEQYSGDIVGKLYSGGVFSDPPLPEV